MTPLTFITKNFKNLMIGVLIIFLIIALMKCNGQKNKNQALELAGKTLEQKVATAEAQRLEGRKQFEDYKKDAEGRHQLVAIEKQEADKKVQQQQKTIDRLVAVIRSENNPDTAIYIIPESSHVWVSKDYKAACDSLPAEIDLLNLALADKDSSINGILDLYNYGIQIRDEEIFKEMNYSDSLKVDFVRQTKLLRSALQQGKPRGQFLVGIGIMGNEDQFLGGASGKAAYLTKGGKMYQYSSHVLKLPGMENAKLYHELSVFFNPFK